VQALSAQVAEREQSVQALSAQVDERDQAIQTLAAQMAEREKDVQILNTRLSQVNNELDQTKAEVLKYALSRSWRITRPLRKFKKFFKREKNA
jgi:hypothetical protein